ncbi:Hsp20/alpha crystallin family protein [Geomonas azotofigens]|uniref:Hsp20/alpha crystallin family protein n=1 Tax=Geomonas azotofigens TaxID=2843196 RepID=UPI001C10A6EA|nr:Hsp20/alpha crystallin family protein [Geomonas azotofigens]MBU5612351.1 Hsp20/alpha crystallin family protein [Geomonas azotofigens]
MRRLERSYGSFIRTCRLPVATITDTAKASFKDGILEGRVLKKTEAISDRVKKLNVE